jgi:wyosine [tRNA(Phe)-imidazoG37] synthetase (radical SAM superfamily)
MTPYEFVIWFQGFAKAANTYNITPKQWDSICEELEKVNLEDKSKKWTRYTLDETNWSSNNTGNITDTTYKQDELTTNTVL